MPELGLAPKAIERIPADLVIVPIFRAERPLREAAGRLDWRLCGALSQLLAADEWEGADGDAVLLPGGAGLRALRVMALGLGVRHEVDTARWEGWTGAALERAAALQTRSLILALPDSAEALAERLECVAEAFAPSPLSQLVLAPEARDAPGVAEWLRSAMRRRRLPGLEIHPPPEARGPRGGGGESSPLSAGRSTR